ncbi:MAG: metallophosphoesterase [Endomicrobiaceae bacterium]|jgi:putative phosphoesterase|nr:metallophosphoesterase [Endomicrobiaceae bacterium]
MKIGILSDTHNNTDKILKAIEFFNLRQVNFVLHAGDFSFVSSAKHFEKLKAPFMAVFGNNDFETCDLARTINKFGQIYDSPYMFVLDGKTFVLTHRICSVEKHFDYMIYGHTHKPSIQKTPDATFINPGEVWGKRYGRSTVAVLETETNRVEIFDLDLEN